MKHNVWQGAYYGHGMENPSFPKLIAENVEADTFFDACKKVVDEQAKQMGFEHGELKIDSNGIPRSWIISYFPTEKEALEDFKKRFSNETFNYYISNYKSGGN